MSKQLSITPLPAFDDNYLWLINDDQRRAVIVDPGDAAPVLQYLQTQQLQLSAILITHHHWDHIDGIDTLLEFFDVPVYGPDSDKIPQVTHPVYQDDAIALFSDLLELRIMAVPGHTRDHIAYFGQIDHKPSLFCGDTLFAGGCGRLFDGTHEQLRQSLAAINQLPAETLIYCTHEYTLANLAFAQAVEPGNQAISERINREQHKRGQQQATLPSTLGLERQTNPFLRYRQQPVTAAINAHWSQNWDSASELFAALRRWKDRF